MIVESMEHNLENEKVPGSGKSLVQDRVCMKYASKKISKCRECRRKVTPYERNTMSNTNSSCRFFDFRRIHLTRNKTRSLDGFNDPFVHPNENDIQLWLPGKDNRLVKRDTYAEETQKDSKKDWDKGDFDIEIAHQIIRQVGDQFCDLIQQERKVKDDYLARVHNDDTAKQSIVWKRVVTDAREMCDLCATTLFNYHWICSKCGFAACIDCYKERRNKTEKTLSLVEIHKANSKEMDEYAWLLCTVGRQIHEPEQLLLTQIIPSNCLIQIDKILHECRSEWGIAKHCNCDYSNNVPCNESLRSLVKGDLVSVMNGNAQPELKSEEQTKKESPSDQSNEAENKSNGLEDVAMNGINDLYSDSDSDDDNAKPSFLRDLLIKSSQNSLDNGNSGPAAGASKGGKKSTMDTLNEVINSVIEHSVKKEKETGMDVEKPQELKFFIRRYKYSQHGREPPPIRIMTLTESKGLYPDVPHSWLCDGRLLRLHDPANPKNYQIFQDQWIRGQPVLVSDVHKYLNKDLWHPDSFSRDFGEQKADLVNCMSGNTVPKQPMWKFWEGFEHTSKRLKDDQGNAMLLKLKDWPPRGDFADVLPSRFADLMKCVPLSEYTHRYGRLNLPSRLPEIFARPDLGPKMYNAYGSALHPDKGTTNLHLDVSDAVNVMVYVGVSKDDDRDEQEKAALKAIDDAGCDILTRKRVRESNDIPGALWHIYAARDADKIRDMLNAVAIERGARLEPHNDAIHDQSFYLDGPLRERLYKDYGVEGYAIVQCLGDAVFVPAGAPHQVRNLHNCIKVAEDFVSPENISHCFHLTQEFRALSDNHTNHEDKLQIKNIIYHAVKDSLTALDSAKEETFAKSRLLNS